MDAFIRTASDKAKNIYSWIEWIVEDNLPLTFCNRKLTNQNTNLKAITYSTLKKYMYLLAEEVKEIISEQLPPTFG